MSLENNLQASQHVTEGTFDASETLPGNFRYKKLDRSSAPAPRNFTLLFFSFQCSKIRLSQKTNLVYLEGGMIIG